MKLTDDERASGRLSDERLALAVRTFRDVGYVVLEDAYDAAFLDTVRAAYDVELDRHLASKGGLAALKGKTFGENHIGFFPPMRGPLADERLAAHPIACQIMDALLGPDFRCSFYHTNTACPGSGYQPIHRDTGSLFGTEFPVAHPVGILVFNVPLCDFTEENGSTEVWPGTHLIVDADPADGARLDERAQLLPSQRTNVPAGSFILRDMRMWHRGMPNRSDHIRTMMAIVYQRAWLGDRPVTIPQSTWDTWSERARRVFRHNRVVPDDQHTPRTWEDG